MTRSSRSDVYDADTWGFFALVLFVLLGLAALLATTVVVVVWRYPVGRTFLVMWALWTVLVPVVGWWTTAAADAPRVETLDDEP